MLNLKGAFSQCDCGSGCGKCLGASGPAHKVAKLDPRETQHLNEVALLTREFAATSQAGFEEALKLLVERASVTPGGGHDEDCRGLASDAVRLFGSLGMEAWIEETGGMPCIAARSPPKEGKAKMNIVVYNHMDVVPAAKEDGWTRAPFTFEKQADAVEGQIYFGRGTTDDKGPALTALYGVLAAQKQGLAVDVSFIWEMEEEIGSPHFLAGLERIRARLPERIDLCICSDTIWISESLPLVVETVRGSVSFDVSLETAEGDVHSGICGGVARNPLNELVQLASEIATPSGVPRLQALQAPPSRVGRDLLDAVHGSVTAESFKQDFSLKSLRTEDPALILQRSWAEPIVEIVGISGGWTGSGVKAAIPPQASLKFNVRLVMPQTPDEVEDKVRAFIAEKLPDAQVSVFGKMMPFNGGLSDEHRRALRKAYMAGFGAAPAFGGVGGSIGVLSTLRSKFGVPVLLPSLSSPSQGYHGKNENYSWKRFENGAVMYAALLAELLL
mmetsp:Transcript_126602/g.369947  ORF Transcript_126602/g.369947 Transcript_126602/m.369947 type:complete len:501 (+) Transcript_126602:68-1570(+)